MEKRFKINQKVILNGRRNGEDTSRINLLKDLGFKFLERNTIYTVRGYTSTGNGIYVNEVINKPMEVEHHGLIEIGFWEDCFSPVIEAKESFKEVTFEKVVKQYPITAS